MPTPFMTLYIRDQEWFHSFLKQTEASGVSASRYVLTLLVHDLEERKLITPGRKQEWHEYDTTAPNRNTRLKTDQKRFLFYIPQDLPWVRDLLKRAAGKAKKSPSCYVRDLVCADKAVA